MNKATSAIAGFIKTLLGQPPIRHPRQPLPLSRQRIRPELEPERLAGGPLPPLHMEGGARADSGPEATPLPAGVRVVDAPVQPLRVEPHRIRDAEDDPLPILENEEPLGLVPGVDREVL